MDLTSLSPEILLLVLSVGILGLDWFLPKKEKYVIGYCAILGLSLIFIVVHFTYGTRLFPEAANVLMSLPDGGSYFQGFVVDALALFFKRLFMVAALLALVYSLAYFSEDAPFQGEYYALILFATLGCFLLVSASDLLAIFVSFELMSLPLYILCSYLKHNSRSSEAGLKYFLMGAVTSALLLYGISLVYGSLGTTDLRHLVSPGPVSLVRLAQDPVLLMGLLFILSALAFKIAAVPFHMWAPDVYEGAPTPVVAFLAVAPKIAVIGLLIRVFLSSMSEAGLFWSWAFAILGALSMTVGNLMALHQQNLKRLLAYSGITQMGYFLVGLSAMASLPPLSVPSLQIAYQAVLFYLVAYLFSELTAFGVVTYLSAKGYETVNSCRGLSSRYPIVSLVFLISLLSLAGIPPMVGFVGKFYLFVAAFSSKLYWLVALGVLNSVVSLFYYLRIAKAMYIEKESQEVKLGKPFIPLETALWVGGFVVVLIGIFPKLVVNLAVSALQRYLVGF